MRFFLIYKEMSYANDLGSKILVIWVDPVIKTIALHVWPVDSDT